MSQLKKSNKIKLAMVNSREKLVDVLELSNLGILIFPLNNFTVIKKDTPPIIPITASRINLVLDKPITILFVGSEGSLKISIIERKLLIPKENVVKIRKYLSIFL